MILDALRSNPIIGDEIRELEKSKTVRVFITHRPDEDTGFVPIGKIGGVRLFGINLGSLESSVERMVRHGLGSAAGADSWDAMLAHELGHAYAAMRRWDLSPNYVFPAGEGFTPQDEFPSMWFENAVLTIPGRRHWNVHGEPDSLLPIRSGFRPYYQSNWWIVR